MLSVKLPLVVLAFGFAQASPVAQRADIGGPVTLYVPKYILAEMTPQDGKEIWGGSNTNIQFDFDGKDYLKEVFTLKLYERQGEWDSNSPSQKLEKKLKCALETEANVPFTSLDVNVGFEAPYLNVGTLPAGLRVRQCKQVAK